MNNVQLIGRLTRDPEIRTTSSQIAVATFTLAVDRDYKNADGTRSADFINCVSWRGAADFVSKYFFKGMKVAVIGSIQTRKWDDQDGITRYATDVVTSKLEFVESKKQDQGGHAPATPPDDPGFDDYDTALPFDI